MSFWDNILEIIAPVRAATVDAVNVPTAGTSTERPKLAAVVAAAEEAKSYFVDGKWSAVAPFKAAHPGRVGTTIVPRTLIVHTTDTYPGGYNAVVKSWTTAPGAGNGAHFLVGRDSVSGVTQFVSIFRNANHAGGKDCGGFKLPVGAVVHPNSCSVGVELDNAGRLVKAGADWVHPDTKKKIPMADVFVDSRGHGWHRVTDYQIGVLRVLWHDLKPVLLANPWPAGTTVSHVGGYTENGVPWAAVTNPILVGHCTTNPIQKTDPGPQVMALLTDPRGAFAA